MIPPVPLFVRRLCAMPFMLAVVVSGPLVEWLVPDDIHRLADKRLSSPRTQADREETAITVEVVLDSAIDLLPFKHPRGEGEWWDGYDAAIADASDKLRELKRRMTEALRRTPA